MKSITIKVLSAALVVLIMVSCSVEKRHYMSGYSVSWKHKSGNVNGQKPDLSVKQNKNSAAGISEVASVVTEVKTSVANSDKNLGEVYASATKGQVKAPRHIVQPTIVKNIGSVNHLVYGVKKNEVLKAAVKSANKNDEIGSTGYIILAIFIPFVAVGIATDWGIETLYNVLWCLLCGFPGIIHAFIVLKRLGKI